MIGTIILYALAAFGFTTLLIKLRDKREKKTCKRKDQK